MNENKNPHGEHRKRKRRQFLEHGLDTYYEHELLEILLFYAIPYKDTSSIARELWQKFDKSLIKVFNASEQELLEVDGIGENAASLIVFFRMLFKIYSVKLAKNDFLQFPNADSLKAFCSSLFINAEEEEIRCLYFTDDLKLISEEKIASGTLGKVELPIRKIAASAFANKCGRLVITHNHPAGTCMPSRADIDATREIRDMFAKLDVELTDHVIIGRDGATSLKESGYLY